MKVSVIIPSSRDNFVSRTVDGLLRQGTTRNEVEIIVVTPEVEKLRHLRELGVVLLGVDQLYPPGKMRNVGASIASGQVLAFIDDDCVPPPFWIDSLSEILFTNKKAAIVGCRLVSSKKTFWDRCADYALFSDFQGDKLRQRPVGSAAILVRRVAFEEVGGFDETLLASEDWEFCLHLQENGWKCFFSPDVDVVHFHDRGSLLQIIKNAYRSGLRSGLVVQERYPDQLSWLAKLSVTMQSPWLYWLLILPYAGAVTLLQVKDFFLNNYLVILYAPFVLLSRCIYHIGVWRNLLAVSLKRQG